MLEDTRSIDEQRADLFFLRTCAVRKPTRQFKKSCSVSTNEIRLVSSPKPTLQNFPAS
jgi:hypothetical protein